MTRLICFIVLVIGLILRDQSPLYITKRNEFSAKQSTDTIKYKDGKKIAYETTLAADSDNSIIIETIYIYNSNYIMHDWISDLNNVVISQKIMFKHKGIILSKQNFNVRKYRIGKSKSNPYFLDNVIREIGIVKGRKGSFYKLYGFGGCNSCSEFLGYFALDGSLLYKIYSSKMDNYYFKYGVFENVMHDYGISNLEIKKSNIKSISVFPPQFSGKVGQTSIN
jgi:hypothetical protein